MGRRLVRAYSCAAVLALVALGGRAATLAENANGAVGPIGFSHESPLVVEGAGWLLGEAQASAQREAARMSPEAVAARRRSRSQFKHLDVAQAAKLARESYPDLVEHRDGAPPQLAAGERITGYPSDYSARLDLGSGRHALIESSAPMALETSHGRRAPLDLSLKDSGGAFRPAFAATGVRIPKRLSEGVQLSPAAVSLTPVDRGGHALSGADGRLDGSTVFYGGTGSDADTLVKPTTSGFEEDTVLRSADSPQQLRFRLRLPTGARLVKESRSGAAQVIDQGTAIATVPAPSAADSEGTPVPVAMTVSGDDLVLAVEHRSGDYRYPIVVDPSVWDEQLNHISPHATNWHYEHLGSAFTASENTEGKGWTEHIAGSHSATEWGAMVYTTQGESYIAWLAIHGKWNDTGAHIENKILIVSPAKTEEAGEALPESESLPNNSWSICNKCSEEPKKGAAGDSAEYAQFATGAGGGVGGENTLTSAQVQIEQEKGPELSLNTTDATVDGGRPNILYGSGSWLGPNRGAFESKAHDPGIGISFFAISASGWNEKFTLYENGECTGGIQCPINFNRGYVYNSKMADGEDTVEAKVYNAMNSFATLPSKKIKVDATAPYNIVVTGLPSGNEIAAKEYHVKAEATDGSGTTPSSGIASLALTVDGREIGTPSGSCSPGPCTAHSGEWTIYGEELGAGEHQIKLTATDAAANVASQTFTMKVHRAAPVGLEIGSVNPQSGEFVLEDNDASLGDGLIASRSYGSRRLNAGAQGPLGPLWALSVGDQQSLVKQLNGSMVLTDSSGGQAIFASAGGGVFTSPPGDANLTLSEVLTEGIKELVLKNAATGASTGFRVPTGGSGEEWVPYIHKGVVATETVTYSFKVVEVAGKQVTEPTQVLAPVPSGVSCTTLVRGCRALTFSYASSTTATGQGQSEWGDYNGRLTQVSYTAYEPTAKEMKTTAVAQYSYDSLGRLRAEWDPRISPALKTLYGYDSAGHLTAISEPGQQPWLLDYGTAPGESVTGRLLSILRPAASTAAWGGQALKNTAVPTLSSNSPVVGVKISVSSNGTWTGSPLAYGYQWEDCNVAGAECTPILGAVNGSYYPTTSDQGHKLVAQVTAANAGGSLLAASAATTSTVAAGTPNSPAPEPPNVGTSSVWTIDYNVPVSGSGAPYALGSSDVAAWAQTDDAVEAAAIFPPDEPMGWPARDYRRATVYYLDEARRTVNVATASGGISTSEYNATNDITRSLSADARSAALKEGAKSAEVSQLLDTQSAYNGEGTELLNTLGPQHAVKLSSGSEVQARSHTVYSYDEGAPAEGGPYRLVTKITRGAEVKGEAEQDKRTTTMSYAGQGGLGWTLRKPTSVTTDPSGLNVTRTTLYDAASGNAIETRKPGDGGKDGWAPPTSSGYFGSSGTGNGQFKSPQGVAVDAGGRVWVADASNNRLEEFGLDGSFIRAVGTLGTGNGQFKSPHDVAIDPAGHVWVADTSNNRVQELTSEGAFIRAFGTLGTGNGQLKSPQGIRLDGAGHVWVADTSNNRLEEFTAEGTFMKVLGSEGTGNGQFKSPYDLAFDAYGDFYVVDSANSRIQEFNPAGEYLRQFGSGGTGNGQLGLAESIAVGPEGNVWVSEILNSRIQEFSPTGTYLTKFGTNGTGTDQFKSPVGIVMHGSTIYVVDSGNSRVQRLSNVIPPSAETYSTSFGTAGTGNGQLGAPSDVTTDAAGNVWVADTMNSRIEEFSAEGAFVRTFGTFGSGNGQLKSPRGLAIDGSGNVWVADLGNNRVEEFTSGGAFVRAFGTKGSGNGQFVEPEGIAIDPSGNVWVADTFNNRLEEFSAEGVFKATVGSLGTGNGQFKTPSSLAFDPSGSLYVLDRGNHRVQEFTASISYLRQFGSEGSGNGQMKTAYRLGVDAAGNVWLSDSSDNRVEEFSPTGTYLAQFGSEGSGSGQFKSSFGVSVRGTTLYALDQNNSRVEKWTIGYLPGDEGAHDAQTIYYSAAANKEYAGCGSHAEWANLPCQTQPTQQPETPGQPGLPVSVYTYNTWLEPATVTATAGSQTRTTTDTYDAAGRPSVSSISSTVGTALPAGTIEYSSETGLPVKQSTGSGAEEKRILDKYNTLGQLTEYTDADGNASTYKYDVDGRIAETTDGKGSQIYGYDETTGELTSLKDSAAGTFTASYDAEGNVSSEHYPNNMNELFTIDPTGETTGVEYQKVGHCGVSCTWFKETALPSIHGETMSQSSTLATHGYSYDNAGRLKQVQETPAGEGCTTRIYEYDKDVNRTALTTRAPGAEGQCASTGGTVEKHSYDSADRLTDESTSYDAFGNTTSLPAKDAGGFTLTSSYYADNTLASLSQNGQTIGYNLDPAGRVRETVSSGTTNSVVIDHYAGSGDSPVWTVEPVSGNWTRNITGIDGLVAIQSSGASPVLQISDLKGDVVGTASVSEAEEKLLSSERSTEFGVPTTSKPPKYSWLGAELRPTELPSGVVSMGARAYVPQIGRFEQTDPIPGGSSNPYGYTDGNPVDETDLTGEYVENNYVAGFNGEENIRAIERELAREQAALEEAERKAEEAAAAAEEEEADAADAADAMAGASSVPGQVKKYCSRISCPSYVTGRKHRSGTLSGWAGSFIGKQLRQSVRSSRDGTLTEAQRQYARKLEIVARELIVASRAVGTKLLGGGSFAYVYNSGPDGSNPTLETGYIQDAKVARR
jgi:RHS repeat-associated protein